MEKIDITNIWVKYLIKKGILKTGLTHFEEDEKEIAEFKRLLYRIKQKETSSKACPTEKN